MDMTTTIMRMAMITIIITMITSMITAIAMPMGVAVRVMTITTIMAMSIITIMEITATFILVRGRPVRRCRG